MNLNNNEIGRRCIICEEFYPTERTDDWGHKCILSDNPLQMCQGCFQIFKDVVLKEKKRQDEIRPKMRGV